MSIPFSNFTSDATTRGNAADTIARGLNVGAWPAGMGGLGKQPTQVNTIYAWTVPGVAVPAGINNQLQDIAAKWQNTREAERRVRIDAFFENIAVMANIPGAPRFALEASIGAGGAGGGTGGAAYPLGAQVGNGPLDYTWCVDFMGAPLWGSNVAIEAKANLGLNGDTGQWQLAAQMATTKQLSFLPPRYRLGILTDSVQWRFYQLDSNLGVLTRTAAVNVNVVGHQDAIVRTIYKFLRYFNADANIWI